MDNELDNGAREDELNKLRATAASPSPSALSTASSGSPLVRGSSAGKRPAPTSIAAAQLQCQQQQQQQQLEFTNRLLGNKKSHGPKQGSRNGTPGVVGRSSVAQAAAARLDWSMVADEKLRPPSGALDGSRGPASASSLSHSGQQAKKLPKGHHYGADGQQTSTTSNDDSNSGANSTAGAHSKSLGYNVAKSIAFRAYRFNEFWSVNKMRYMNLACLLMTLICLVTILIFTGTNSNTPATTGASKPLSVFGPQSGGELMAGGKSAASQQQAPPPIDADQSESLDSLNSQPLVSGAAAGGQLAATTTQAPAPNGANKQVSEPFDDFNLFDERRDNKSSARRKLHESQALEGEREIEEPTTTATTNTLGQPSAITEAANGADWIGDRWPSSSSSNRRQLVAQAGDSFPLAHPGSLLDPILNQIFQDMELGNLFKPLRRHSSSGANGTSGPTMVTMTLKPVVRRSKNGATIVISGSSSSFNDSSASSELPFQLPSLIEKLLPPMLRPPMGSSSSAGSPMMMMMMMKPSSSSPFSPLTALESANNSTGNATGLASATITFGSEPIFASSSGPSMVRLNPFGPLDPFAPLASSHHGHHNYQRPAGLFMEPFGANSIFRSPFGPMLMPPPPPPGLLSMIMRSNQASNQDSDDDLPPFVSVQRSPFMPQATSFTIMANDNKEQQQKNDTLPVGQASQNSSISRQSDSAVAGDSESADGGPMEPGAAASSHPRPATKGLFPRPLVRAPGSAGSMLILSSSASNSRGPTIEPAPFPMPLGFGPFMGMGLPPISPLPPHMVLLGGGNGDGPMAAGGQSGPLNPILRSILNSAMSELSSSPFQQVAAANDDRHGNRSSGTGQSNKQATAGARVDGTSSVAPSWSIGQQPQSPIGDPDDEWTGVQQQGDSIDRWDEQAQGKHLRARHRDADSDLEPAAAGFEPADFVAGLQMEHPAQASPIMESIRQTIRGPGLTVERIIEVPSSSAGRVGPGVKSQSLSRADYEDYEAQQPQHPAARHHHGMGPMRAGSSPFGRPLDNRGEEPPVGLIGRLLSDFARGTQRGEQPNRSGRGRALLDDDLDEGDSSEESMQRPAPPSWPKVRVASARIRMRPLAAEPRSSEETAFSGPEVEPTGPNDIRESPGFFMMHQRHHHHQTKEQAAKLALEDTLNSMEDRLATLGDEHEPGSVMVTRPAQQVAAAGRQPEVMKPSAGEQPQLQPRGMIPQHLIGQQHHNPSPQGAENPFTSPSSPLFGFPASSPAARGSNQEQVAKGGTTTSSATSGNELAKNSGSSQNKQQKSFTYHSNHELAAPFANGNNNKQQVNGGSELTQTNLEQERTLGRARFLAPFAPANIVMGRRLDDQPSEFGSDTVVGQSNQVGEPMEESAMRISMSNHAAFVPAAAVATANSNTRMVMV